MSGNGESDFRECRCCASELAIHEFQHRDGKPVGRVCKACRANQVAEWHKRNPERSREIKRRYAEKYPEREAASKAAYRERNRNGILCRSLQRKRANREVINQKNREQYANDPSPFIERESRRRQRERDAPGKFGKHERRRLLDLQNWQCAKCGTAIDESGHADHIQPLALGGSHDIENRQMLCKVCNHTKGLLSVDYRCFEEKHGVSIFALP